MAALTQDVRYAVRMLAKNPGFASVAILTLAVGIGLNTAVFTLLHAMLFLPPVEKSPSTFVRAVAHYTGWYRTEDLFDQFTALDYQAMRDQSRSLTTAEVDHRPGK
jgi:putative ABC transport system permease protein